MDTLHDCLVRRRGAYLALRSARPGIRKLLSPCKAVPHQRNHEVKRSSTDFCNKIRHKATFICRMCCACQPCKLLQYVPQNTIAKQEAHAPRHSTPAVTCTKNSSGVNDRMWRNTEVRRTSASDPYSPFGLAPTYQPNEACSTTPLHLLITNSNGAFFKFSITTMKVAQRTSDDIATIDASRLRPFHAAGTEMHSVAVPVAVGKIRENATPQMAGDAARITGQTVAAK
jgi:hypothetical protein